MSEYPPWPKSDERGNGLDFAPQYGAIVELVKTPGFHPGDCGFEPRWHPHVAVAQLVRAPGCGPGGCGFEFRQSPQMRL